MGLVVAERIWKKNLGELSPYFSLIHRTMLITVSFCFQISEPMGYTESVAIYLRFRRYAFKLTRTNIPEWRPRKT